MASDTGRGPEDQLEIVPAGKSVPLTIQYVRRTLTVHTISDEELESLASPTSPLHSTFFGVAAGAFISLLIVVLTTAIPDPRNFAVIVSLTILTPLSALYFGFRWYLDWKATRRRLLQIRRNQGVE